MKSRNGLTTGLVLIITGVVWILWNMGLISYEQWEGVLRYWPVLLILAGLSMMIGGENTKSLSFLLIVLALISGLLNHSGKLKQKVTQEWWEDSPDKRDRSERKRDRERRRNEKDAVSSATNNRFQYELTPEIKEGILKIEGGAGVYILKDQSPLLFQADIESDIVSYRSSLKTNKLEGVATVALEQEGDDVNIGGTKIKNEVKMLLNPDIMWTVDLDLGAGKADLDLSPFKVKELNIETGASALDIKLGDKVENMKVKIDSGLAALVFRIPSGLGCEVKLKGDLNLEDFEGFVKVSKGLYRTEGFSVADNKVFLEVDSGLSKIDIKKY